MTKIYRTPVYVEFFLQIRSDLAGLNHCKLTLQLKNKLRGKAVTHSEKLQWWIV